MEHSARQWQTVCRRLECFEEFTGDISALCDLCSEDDEFPTNKFYVEFRNLRDKIIKLLKDTYPAATSNGSVFRSETYARGFSNALEAWILSKIGHSLHWGCIAKQCLAESCTGISRVEATVHALVNALLICNRHGMPSSVSSYEINACEVVPGASPGVPPGAPSHEINACEVVPGAPSGASSGASSREINTCEEVPCASSREINTCEEAPSAPMR